ncbi:hypothetical protein VTO73DRAFT_3821 [Trametes versicolor]
MSLPVPLLRCTCLERFIGRTQTSLVNHPSLTILTMLSSTLTAFVLGALPLLAAATPLDTRTAGKCSTGPLQCCNNTQKANDPTIAALLALIGVNVQGVDALVGVDCSPITVVGVATGNSCNAQTVCCTDNNIGGLVSAGCVPGDPVSIGRLPISLFSSQADFDRLDARSGDVVEVEVQYPFRTAP